MPSVSKAAMLAEVRTVDDETIMIHWLDGKAIYPDDGKGAFAFMGHESRGADTLQLFSPALDVSVASSTMSYTLKSADDPGYFLPTSPAKCSRKTKVQGTAWGWPEPKWALEHTVFLHLPKKLMQSKTYELKIASSTGSDIASKSITFDVFKNESEAVHVNLVGYNPQHTAMKSADLYMWMGDSGAKNYSKYEGRKVMILNTKTGQKQDVGSVKFWKKSGDDYGKWNLTRSDVWTCDFSNFNKEGTYRLVVDGVGCSPKFNIQNDAYQEAFKTSLRGFYYMRIGEPKTLTPPPRQPRFIPGVDPKDFTVYLTTYSPWHPDWPKKGGDQWDNKDWSMYKEPGNPTNPNAYGGHSDALDWDRHAGHISIIWDMLLPYVLSNGKGGEDNLGILESGNKIPDVIDESRNEVDMWLRLRDRKGGYASGLNNPTENHKIMYQGAAKPYMAWASAANCAMLAESLRIAGQKSLAAKYREESIKAWNFANEQDLDLKHTIGNGAIRGRDLKMMAAAYLYNLTGDRKFEDVIAKESVIKNATSFTEETDKSNQLWGTAAYLMCAKFKLRPIHYPELLSKMQLALLHEARTKNVANTLQWPSRRSSDNSYGWFQTIQEVQRVCVAHAISDSQAEKNEFLRALILEADYGLGRNPMNMVQMTGLGSRSVGYIYTSGRNDGVPGCHPGHTPYMNSEPWGQDFMANPRYYASKGYPEWSQWPHGEALWNAPYCYSNNEFTPQQSMRGKHCLLAYLHILGSK